MVSCILLSSSSSSSSSSSISSISPIFSRLVYQADYTTKLHYSHPWFYIKISASIVYKRIYRRVCGFYDITGADGCHAFALANAPLDPDRLYFIPPAQTLPSHALTHSLTHSTLTPHTLSLIHYLVYIIPLIRHPFNNAKKWQAHCSASGSDGQRLTCTATQLVPVLVGLSELA